MEKFKQDQENFEKKVSMLDRELSRLKIERYVIIGASILYVSIILFLVFSKI